MNHEDKEAMDTLLSDSEDEEGDGDMYKMLEMNSAGKNGILLKKKPKGANKTTTAGWMFKGVLGLSLTLNVLMFVFMIMSSNKESGGRTNHIPCALLSSTQSSLPSPTSSSSSSSSSSLSSSISPIPPKNPISPTPTEDADIQHHRQQQQQQLQEGEHQLPQAPCPSCAPGANIPMCGGGDADQEGRGEKEAQDNDRNKKEYTNIFADLTVEEMKGAFSYLLRQKSLNIGTRRLEKKCEIILLELHTPNKTGALLHLDSYAPKPTREAQALVACEYSRPPVIKEIVIGPLPHPVYHRENPRRNDSKLPYKFHPTYGMTPAYRALVKEILSDGIERIATESYGVSTLRNCQAKCVTFLSQKTSSAYNDDVIYTFTAYYATEFTTINPLDLIYVIKEMIPYGKLFVVTDVFYGGQNFKNSATLIQAYDSGTLKKTRMTFPKPDVGETSVPGSINLRGDAFPAEPKAGPKSYEPDGKRYSIKNQHVNYLKWSFNTRLNVDSGPQLWDVRWGDERIAYEISLQDVGVIYAGANPMSFFAHLSDSAFGLGNKATGMLPGLDCPEGATFLPKTVINQEGRTHSLPHSQCVFEHNTERPLRRHRNNDGVNGANHGGLVDRVLIVRTVIVEYNYDYIFDMIFHQNGALELKTFATGYVMSQHYYNGEKPFGFKIYAESVGSIHSHIFNYKIDLDILGTSNRYESLDMALDERPWGWYHQGKEPFKQVSFQHNLRTTEMDAVLRYNYSNPKYHIVYNNEMKNKFGNQRAYRIATKGFSKLILPDDSPVLNSRRWAKYDMLVTKRKDSEERSSSMFSMFDGASPHVDIDRYLEDNEPIVDEDLVFWITVGMHHIPHTEDIPNTPTIGTEASILITPYNYFRECPSVASRDSIRLDNRKNTVVKQDYGIDGNKQCIPMRYNFEELFYSATKIYTH